MGPVGVMPPPLQPCQWVKIKSLKGLRVRKIEFARDRKRWKKTIDERYRECKIKSDLE